MLLTVATLLCLSLARLGESTKLLKTLPTISNSLVNLGKVDISFYFNSKNADPAGKELRTSRDFQLKPPYISPNSLELAPCPCSALRTMKENPSDMLSNILTGKDLFTFTTPTSSYSCCDSHENQEETIFFDIGPKLFSKPEMQIPEMILDAIRPNKAFQPKTMEILLFPPKKFLDFPKMSQDIKKVGGKTFKPLETLTTQSSVKKDLNFQPKDITETAMEEEKNSVTMNINAL